MEEAQVIASEYIYTLENIPGEVQHLLTEIRLKDEKSQELQGDIHQRTQRYIRQSIKANGNGNGKEPPSGIDEQYAELDKLASDKIRIAQRLLDVLHRACGRLDVDLARILAANGEPADVNALAAASTSNIVSQQPWAQVRNAPDRLRESFKTEPEPSISNPGSPLPSSSISTTAPFPKKRRLNPTSEPSPLPSGAGTPTRSARGPSFPSRGRRSTSVLEMDVDAENDDDEGKDAGDQDDQSLYCYCRKRSYGEMVACDNPNCPYQWFHISCLQIKGSLPESWYCQDCAPKFQGGGAVEKGRKGRKPRNQ